MDVAQLKAFLAVAEVLHFGRAAEALHLAQPHLSRTVRHLEDDLGMPLFSRTSRRVELTAAGEALVEPARAALRALEEARDAAVSAHEGRSGRLRLTFAGPSSHAAVSRLARTLRRTAPDVRLDLLPGWYGSAAVTELLEGRTDLVVARFTTPPDGLEHHRAAAEQSVVVVPDDHDLSRRSSLTIEDLRGQPLVTLPASAGSEVRRALVRSCLRAGFTPDVVQEAPDTWTSVALVAAGVGLHLTTGTAVAQTPADGVRVVPVDGVEPVFVFLLWRPADTNPVLPGVLRRARGVFRPTSAEEDAPVDEG